MTPWIAVWFGHALDQGQAGGWPGFVVGNAILALVAFVAWRILRK